MKCGAVWGAHILLEAKIDENWATFDPFYDLSFRKENGRLASFQEVKGNWDYFKKQVPPNYNSLYTYEDVRYTNWTKIPLVMPAVKRVLRWFMGSEVENLSIRSLVLNLYKAYLAILAGCYLLLVMFTAFVLSARSSPARLPGNRPGNVTDVIRRPEDALLSGQVTRAALAKQSLASAMGRNLQRDVGGWKWHQSKAVPHHSIAFRRGFNGR
jgi:hypothetical protein